MTSLIVSNFVLWLIVIALAFVVFALTRQIGVLHQRIAPIGALQTTKPPAAGEVARRFDLIGIDDTPIAIGGVRGDGRHQLLFFMSLTCPICKSLLPNLNAYQTERHETLEIVIIADGEKDDYRQFAGTHEVNLPIALSADIGPYYQVTQLPYVVLLDADGQVHSGGVCNRPEDLDNLAFVAG